MEITINQKNYVLLFDHQSELNANRQYLASTNGKICSRLSTFRYDVGEPLPEGGAIEQIITFEEMNSQIEEILESQPKRRRKKVDA
ncbi:hypothetical protein MY04_5536 [Flammeovirga sp. MY04]|uniref:hypothetical protein n=1 Tax=Flammeovirga sp. MY04 TaxID=1191459 RepID=UPI0008063717|nr:hypothetical protein [Flammeovirga sp. MY04]ANQ52867.1 hypothetical protein MY04_5536 [Flammeovirga sp. MY04]